VAGVPAGPNVEKEMIILLPAWWAIHIAQLRASAEIPRTVVRGSNGGAGLKDLDMPNSHPVTGTENGGAGVKTLDMPCRARQGSPAVPRPATHDPHGGGRVLAPRLN
jgi:hypothetical protein